MKLIIQKLIIWGGLAVAYIVIAWLLPLTLPGCYFTKVGIVHVVLFAICLVFLAIFIVIVKGELKL